eukprot:1248271-Pyramimonas_sp.AAC.1
MLTDLTSLGCLGKYNDLEAVSWAAKFRLVSRCSEFFGILEDLEKVFKSGDACIVRAASGWANASFALAFLATYRSARGILVASPNGTPEEGKLFQAAVYRVLSASPDVIPWCQDRPDDSDEEVDG